MPPKRFTPDFQRMLLKKKDKTQLPQVNGTITLYGLSIPTKIKPGQNKASKCLNSYNTTSPQKFLMGIQFIQKITGFARRY